MGYDIGPRIGIEGESEHRKQINGLVTQYKTLNTEMQAVTSAFDKNDKSQENLTSQNKILVKQIEVQTQKLDLLKNGLSAASGKYGENDRVSQGWQQAVNKATAELNKMERQLEKNQTVLQNSQKNTESLSFANDILSKSVDDPVKKIGNLKAALEESTEKYGENAEGTALLKDALKKAEEKTDSLGGSIRELTQAMGLDLPPALDGMVSKLDGVSKSGAALTAVLGATVFALYKATMNTKEAAGEIDELSHKTGMSVEKIQELNYAAEFLEISAEDIGSSIAKMTKNMDTARSGTGDAAEAFKELHINIKNGNGSLKDSETVFYQVIDALGKVKNETDKDALSMAIFGKSAMSLNNLILEGSDNIKAYAAEAQNMGYVMDKDTIDKFNDLDDAMVRWNKSIETTGNSMAMALLPMLTAMFEAFGKIPTPVLQATAVIAGIVATIVLTVKTIKELTATGSAITGFFKLADGSMDMTKVKILAVVAALVALAAIIAVIIGKSGEIQSTFASIGNSVGKINGQVNTVSTQGTYQRIGQNAGGTNFWRGGPTWVGENGPEIVDLPRGSKVYPNGVYPQSGGDTYYITIPAKDIQEFNDIVRIAKNQRRRGVQGV